MMSTTLLPLLLLVAIIFALMIFLRPDWGLLLLIIMLYTRLSDILINYYDLPSVAKFYIPFLGLVILVRWLVYNERPKNWGVPVAVLAGYSFLAILSMIYADFPELSRNAFVLFLKDGIAILAIILLLKDQRDLQRVIWALLSAGIFLER